MTFAQFLLVLRARIKLVLAVIATFVLLSVLITVLMTRKYTATSSVVVEIRPDPISGGVVNMMNATLMATQVDIINSDRVARRVIRNLHLGDSPEIRAQWQKDTDGKGTLEDWLATLLQRNLEVKPSRDSGVVQINYSAPDPAFAAAIANAFVQAYLDISLELRVDPARRYAGFFDARAKQARETLEKAQAKLSDYQRSSGITGTDERLDVETARLNELSSQLVAMQSVVAESKSRQAQAAGGNGDRLGETLQNPVISNLKVDLGRAEANLQDLSSRLGANHPQVMQAKASIAELKSRIESETKRVTSGVGVSANINESRLADIKGQLDAQRSKVLKLKQDHDVINVLQHEVEIAQRNFDEISLRTNQTTLESQSQQSNINVLSEATPPVMPSSPRIVLNIVLGFLLGIVAAVCAAVLRELRDRRLRTDADLVELLGLPLLGALPKPVRGRDHASGGMAQRVISGRLTRRAPRIKAS